MAITLVSASRANGTGSSISVAKPTGLASGDFIIAIIHINGPKNSSDNNGATAFTSVLLNREYNGPSAQVDLYSRVAGGSEPTSYSFSLDGSDRYECHLLAFRGVNTTTPWEVQPTSTTEATGSGGTSTTNTITTTNNGAMVVSFSVNDSNSLTFTATPSGYTVAYNSSGTQLLSDVYGEKTTAGLVSALSWTQSTSNGTWLNNIFALTPAGTNVTVNPEAIAVSPTITAPTVTYTANYTVQPTTIDVSPTMGVPTLSYTANYTLTPDAIINEVGFDTPTITVESTTNVTFTPEPAHSFSNKLILVDYWRLAKRIDDGNYISL